MIKKIITRFSIGLAISILILQIPMINTALTQGAINLILPKGMSIHISRFRGIYPFKLFSPKIKIKDETGKNPETWLQIENFFFSWAAIDLFYGNFHLEKLSAQSVELFSIPMHLIHTDDDPIFFPYINVDNFGVSSVKIPFLFPGDFTLNGKIVSTIEDEHTAQFQILNHEIETLPSILKADYHQKGSTYTLTIDSEQKIKSFRTMAPILIDQISEGFLSLNIDLTGETDFLAVHGDGKLSLTKLESTNEALNKIIGSEASCDFKITNRRESDRIVVQVEKLRLETARDVLINAKYHHSKVAEGNINQLTAEVKIPDYPQDLFSIPLSGPTRFTLVFNRDKNESFDLTFNIHEAMLNSYPISASNLIFKNSPDGIKTDLRLNIPDHGKLSLESDLIVEDNHAFGFIKSSGNWDQWVLDFDSVISHSYPLLQQNENHFKWDIKSLTLRSPKYLIASLQEEMTLKGKYSDKLNSLEIPDLFMVILDGTLTGNKLIWSADTAPSGSLKLNNISLNTLIKTLYDFSLTESNALDIHGNINADFKLTENTLSKGSFTIDQIQFKDPILKDHTPFTLKGDFTQNQGQISYTLDFRDGVTSQLMAKGIFATSSTIPSLTDLKSYDISGEIDLTLIKYLTASPDKYDGKLLLNIKGSGENQATGTLSTQHSYYENAAFGMILKNINLNANLQNRHLKITSLTAQDPLKGQISLSGDIDLTTLESPKINLKASLSSFLLSNTDEVILLGGGKIDINSNQNNTQSIAGNLTIEGAQITLNNRSTEPKTINLYRNDYELRKQKDTNKSYQQKNPLFLLDLIISIPQKLYINGYGLKSEWKGSLHVSNSLSSPKITGTLESKKGQLEIASKRLKLDKSTISFRNETDNLGFSEIIPVFNIQTSKEVQDYTAYIIIKGTPQSPNIEFKSTPALSKEEVIALILFDKPLSSASTAQSLQLAQAIASLNKNSFSSSIFDKLTNILGVDEISLAENERKDNADDSNEDLGNAYSLRLGKQLNDRVYLGVEQGVRESNETRALLKIDITKNTKIDIETGTEDSSIGYNWEKRY